MCLFFDAMDTTNAQNMGLNLPSIGQTFLKMADKGSELWSAGIPGSPLHALEQGGSH
jgi:hypothetical protein